MPIDFGPERWEKVKKTYDLWWKGKLGRPIIPVKLLGRDPGRPEPRAPLLSQETCTDLSITPGELIDRIDYELCGCEFLGDAYPYFNMDCFGPGVAAAFCGARLDNSTGGVWFSVDKAVPIQELHFEYDAGNPWLNRVTDICRAGMERWQGQVLVGMADLGGVLDILATFRTSEGLLLDLCDYPEEVERACRELQDLWFRFYGDINSVLQPVNPGYSDWSDIYSDKPSYMTQCDFSYMISPAMFDRFAKPQLMDTFRRLPRSFYHLDGVGELPHLDSLLSIKELDGVQWVPGSGKPVQTEWPEVYRKIYKAGKKTQVWDGFDCLDMIYENTGADAQVHHKLMISWISEKDYFLGQMAKYGAE